MIVDKRRILKPLLESRDDLHLTGYLANKGDLIDLKMQLRNVIETASSYIEGVMPADERVEFLEPLESLRHDARILAKMKGNIGLFRTPQSFRVLNLPVEVEETCVVATTFHVKPLLRWMQVDPEFLLLGLDQTSAHLYWGDQSSFVRLEAMPVYKDSFAYLDEWIRDVTKSSKPRLYVAGDPSLTARFLKDLRYSNVHAHALLPSFGEGLLPQIIQLCRNQQKAEVSAKLERAFAEFRMAESLNLSKKNIFQIAKAVFQGRVRKLIVADEIKIFGKLDRKSGGMAVHPFDLDHEDDDILDDLAQTVLSQGGEVVVAPRDQIPKGRLALAILNHTKQRPRENAVP